MRTLRRLLACAFAAVALFLTQAACAQSSVSLYGLVDEYVGMTQLPGQARSWSVAGGGMSTSYFGFKGSEQLAPDIKAIFALEAFFRAESGQYGSFPGDTFFGRNAYVGIESLYGTLTAGRLTTQLFVSTVVFNPFGDSYTFSPIVNHVFLGLGTFPSFSTDQGVVGGSDWDSAVQYQTPDFKGLSGAAMYAFGGQAGDGGAKKYSFQFLYFNGPFAATGVYQYVNYNSAPGDLSSVIAGLSRQTFSELGATYDFKLVKLFLQYAYANSRVTPSGFHVNTAQAGISVPVGPGSILASYAYSDDASGLRQHRNSAALGYDYRLSKRTDVYTAYLLDKISGMSSGQTLGVGIRSKF